MSVTGDERPRGDTTLTHRITDAVRAALAERNNRAPKGDDMGNLTKGVLVSLSAAAILAGAGAILAQGRLEERVADVEEDQTAHASAPSSHTDIRLKVNTLEAKVEQNGEEIRDNGEAIKANGEMLGEILTRLP